MNENELLMEALIEACKFIRKNPPGQFPEEDFEEMSLLLCGGESRDPEGIELSLYFLSKARFNTLNKKEK